MCTTTVIFLPWGLYVVAVVLIGFRASLETGERAPGIFWQFKRQSYTTLGWKYWVLGMRMMAGALPLVLLLALIARLFCADWNR